MNTLPSRPAPAFPGKGEVKSVYDFREKRILSSFQI